MLDDYEDFVKAIREEEEMSKTKSLTRKKMKRSDKLQAEGHKRMIKKMVTREAKDFMSRLRSPKRSIAAHPEASVKVRKALAEFKQKISEV
jgi:hypothetical protein|tara:strand:+ start:198 stop:470 length:273 start_codon:yes stop_codon:yes gene_type:complete